MVILQQGGCFIFSFNNTTVLLSPYITWPCQANFQNPLGNILDSKLKNTWHIVNVINKTIGVLLKLHLVFPRRALANIFKIFFRHRLWSCLVWSSFQYFYSYKTRIYWGKSQLSHNGDNLQNIKRQKLLAIWAGLPSTSTFKNDFFFFFTKHLSKNILTILLVWYI